MNDRYIRRKSGDIVVLDEYGKPSEITNNDNLEEFLRQENIVETIENKIKELTKELNEYPSLEKINNKKYIPTVSSLIIMVALLSILITGIETGDFSILMEATKLGEGIKVYHLIVYPCLIFSSTFGLLLDLSFYKNHQETKRKVNAKTAALEELRKRKVEEQKKLDILGAKQIIKDCEIVKISNDNIQQVVDEEELFYLHIESNFKRYYEAYKSGTLEEILSKENFTEIGIKAVRDYIEKRELSINPKRKSRKRKYTYLGGKQNE